MSRSERDKRETAGWRAGAIREALERARSLASHYGFEFKRDQSYRKVSNYGALMYHPSLGKLILNDNPNFGFEWEVEDGDSGVGVESLRAKLIKLIDPTSTA